MAWAPPSPSSRTLVRCSTPTGSSQVNDRADPRTPHAAEGLDLPGDERGQVIDAPLMGLASDTAAPGHAPPPRDAGPVQGGPPPINAVPTSAWIRGRRRSLGTHSALVSYSTAPVVIRHPMLWRASAQARCSAASASDRESLWPVMDWRFVVAGRGL